MLNTIAIIYLVIWGVQYGTKIYISKIHHLDQVMGNVTSRKLIVLFDVGTNVTLLILGGVLAIVILLT